MEGMEITRVEYRPAVITADFAAMQRRLDEALEPYSGVTLEAIQDMPEKDVKACAKDLRAMRKDLEEGRKGVKREYNRPLDAFELEVKKLVAQIDMHLELFKEVEQANEARRKANRMEAYRAAYMEFLEGNGMESLADLVPVERLVQPQWLNKSFSERKACDQIAHDAAKVMGEWEQLRGLELAHRDECEAVFFDKLDLSAALAHEKARNEQDARVQAMREQADAMRAEAEAYRAEPQADQPTAWERDEPMCYVVRMLMTASQRQQLAGFMRAAGIRGDMGLMTETQAGQFKAKMGVA